MFTKISMIRISTLLFSFFAHGFILGVLYLFSSHTATSNEIVYRVSLAELQNMSFNEPQGAGTSAEPEPEPVVELEPQIVKEEVKQISPKKEEKPKPEPKTQEKPKPKPEPKVQEEARPERSNQENTSQNSSSQNVGNGGGAVNPFAPRSIGGLMSYDTKQVDILPSIVKSAVPEYPRKAQRMNIEGRVIVQLVVDTSGKPVSCTVVQAEPEGYFEESALKAAGKMRFKPGEIKGKKVNTLVHIPIVFKMR